MKNYSISDLKNIEKGNTANIFSYFTNYLGKKAILWVTALTILLSSTFFAAASTKKDETRKSNKNRNLNNFVIPESPYANMKTERIEGKINMFYGANEDDNWKKFVGSQQAQQYHIDVGTKILRIWASSQWYRENTIPYDYYTDKWDFANLDSLVEATLKIGATPFVCLAHSPKGTFPEREHGIEGHWELPPYDLDEFADYVANVVQHYVDKYGNIDNWYFEIWNEPAQDEWWADEPPIYAQMFDKVAEKVRKITNARIGGPTGVWCRNWENEKIKRFLEHCNPDFVSLHQYGVVLDENEESSRKERMENIKEIYYDSIIDLRTYIDEVEGNYVQIINSEYNLDWSNYENLNDQFTAAWYTSSLIHEIKSGSLDAELFYQGTAPYSEEGKGHYGMWSYDLKPWPLYDMKKLFVAVNQTGSTILNGMMPDDITIDSLAVENDDGRFITLVNTKDENYPIDLNAINGDFTKLIDIVSNNIHDKNSNLVLKPYEVKFLQID